MRKLQVQTPEHLGDKEWIFIYDHRLFDIADRVANDLMTTSKSINMKVCDPYFIETDSERNLKQVEDELIYYMTEESGEFKHPKIVVILLGYENNYPAYKKLMQKYRLTSQCLTRNNASKFNYAKAVNILRQMNSKMGGDLYSLQFPKKMDSMLTMLVGIDVCHAGSKSIVGLACTINKTMS